MALCLAHTAAAYLAYEAIRPAEAHRPGLLAAAVGLANAPDLDFVPGLIVGHPGAYHRGLTHTVVAVVAVAAIAAFAAWLTRPGWRPLRAAAWVGAVWASHLVVDYFTTDVVPPSGARFLWPFSDRYWIAPVTPLAEVVIDPSGRRAFFASIFNTGTVRVWLDELVLLLGAVVAVHALRRVRQIGPVWRGVGEET
jgi:membrane-bound metal-dependent hydrolase YbcI (DUF457 family)